MTNLPTAEYADLWLKQYMFDAEMDDLELNGNDNADTAALGEAVDDYDQNLASGQIRILNSRCVANAAHIPYVAILGKWDDRSWLVAPFSRFTIPAVSGEMLTGLDFGFEAVIQSWNARVVPTVLLCQSWLSGQLPENVRMDAYDLFRHIATGTPLMETFSSQMGPALTDPTDLRNNYMHEEKEQFAPLDLKIQSLNTLFLNSCIEIAGHQEKQAAAGQPTMSELVEYDGQHYVSMDYVECQNFEPVNLGDTVPEKLYWCTDNLAYDGAFLIFRHAKSGEVLGTGQGFINGDEVELYLLTPAAEAIGQAIDSTEDIQIVVVR